MSTGFHSPGDDPSMRQQAAAWVLRHDRGLTAAEQDEFSAWLAADPRHGRQLARERSNWNRLDQLAEWRPEHSARPNPDLLAPPLRFRLRRFAVPVLAAVAVAAVFTIAHVTLTPPASEKMPLATVARSAGAFPPAENQRVLEDGSIIELNVGAVVSVHFTSAARRVRLEHGEAHFLVTKDSVRPFVVSAGGVDVRAIGTAFNVRFDPAAVEVLVTEGRVRLDPSSWAEVAPNKLEVGEANLAFAPSGESAGAFLDARQRAVVSFAPEAFSPQIATLTKNEIERVLAWQHRLLDFTGQPLTTIIAEFNRRNVTQLVVVDPELARVRVSASIRSDNVEGFVRLLEAGFGARSERRGQAEILLRRAK